MVRKSAKGFFRTDHAQTTMTIYPDLIALQARMNLPDRPLSFKLSWQMVSGQRHSMLVAQ